MSGTHKVLVLLPLLFLQGSEALFAWDPAPDFEDRLRVEAKNFLILPGGVVGRFGGATGELMAGGMVAMSLDVEDQSIGIRIRGELEEEERRNALVARSRFVPGSGLVLQLEWFRDGAVARQEDVLLADFASVTRTLHEEPDGSRHVIRYSPFLAEEEPEEVPAESPALSDFLIGLGPGPVLRDGELIVDLRSRGTGMRTFVNLPGEGFFQFSFHSFAGANTLGRVEDGAIRFVWGGAEYSFYSTQPVPLPGSWQVHVAAHETVPVSMRGRFAEAHWDRIFTGSMAGSD